MTADSGGGPRPSDVLLSPLIAALPKQAGPRREGDSLIVDHPNFTTRLDVVQPPAGYKPNFGTIFGVLQIRSELPAEFVSTFKGVEWTPTLNMNATIAALTLEDGKIFVGSRATFYGDDRQAWKLYFPLVSFALFSGTTSLMGATRRMFAKEKPRGGRSLWTKADFDLAEKYLSNMCVCTTGDTGLTAEFGLNEGDTTAMQGDPTALLRLMNDQPHPEMGGGLFCLLLLPHHLKDEKSLVNLVIQLNRMEMEPKELAPHFGAWCRDESKHSPAYVSFLPNSLHSHDIALNVAIWAKARTKWANAVLASLGLIFGQTC